MDFEPHNSHFLSQLESQESIDIPLDQKVSFKVILLKKDLFQKLDGMDDQFMPSKEANIRLFQRKDQPNATPLGCDLGNLKVSWSKIQKIEIKVGHQIYKPFANNKIVARVEKPEFMDFERELYPASTDALVNDILIDIKLAEERLKN